MCIRDRGDRIGVLLGDLQNVGLGLLGDQGIDLRYVCIAEENDDPQQQEHGKKMEYPFNRLQIPTPPKTFECRD